MITCAVRLAYAGALLKWDVLPRPKGTDQDPCKKQVKGDKEGEEEEWHKGLRESHIRA